MLRTDSVLHRLLLACAFCLLATVLTAETVRAQAAASAGAANAEQSVPDSLLGTWQYDAQARLNFSQAAYKDWEEGGGTGSLAFTAGLGGQASKRTERWIQDHEIRLALGLIDQEGREVRKAEDQIYLNTSLRYDGDGFFQVFNPTIAADLRTQFAKGFDYDSNPFEGEVSDTRTELETPVQNSAFFAPAFLTESIGLTYEPVDYFTVRLGAASKQTVVREPDFRVLYGVDPDNSTRIEAGAELAAALDKKLTENIRYRSQLNVFASFNQTEDPPDARWNNTVNLKVNDWLSTDLQFVALFDKDITNTIQLKETISVGVSFTLL